MSQDGAQHFNHEAERNLLGTLIEHADEHATLFARLRAEHFDHVAYREVYAELLVMRDADEVVDNYTLGTRLREQGKMGAGPAFAIDSVEYEQLTTYATHPEHASAHADIVIKLWADRRMRDYGTRLVAATETGRRDLWPAILQAQDAVLREATSNGERANDLRFLSDDECEQMQPARGIVGSILFEDSIAFLYAREGRWKTFLALDWCLSCATGRKWLGRPVVTGAVAYIAAEGARGIGKRIRAWKRHHGVSESVPIYVLPKPVQLLDSGQVRALIAQIREQIGTPVLVVIDTLARSMAGGNENDSKDINAVTDAAYMIRAAFSCCVLTLHHTGKDEARGMRGSSALRGNADNVLRIVGNDSEPSIKPGEPITLRSEKSKDGDPFEDVTLTTELEQWATEDGVFHSSLVIVPGDPDAAHASHATLTESQQTALDVLYAAPKGLRATPWESASGLAHRTFYDARDQLVKFARVSKNAATAIYTVTEAGREHVSAEV